MTKKEQIQKELNEWKELMDSFDNTCSTCEHFLTPNICQYKSDYTWYECNACEFYKK